MTLRAILFFAAVAGVACSGKPSKDEELAEELAIRSARPLGVADLRAPAANAQFLLAVLAGQGTGPIRIGASVTQVERLMQSRCEVLSENLCRYVTRGIDFNLLGGITQSMYIQRAGRPAGKNADGKDVQFGFFVGAIPPDLRLGMTPEAIQEYLGKPYRAEKVPGPNPQNTVWRHYYPGMTIEYDFWPETKRLILGGIRIFKDPNAVPAGAVDAGAPVSDAGAPPDAAAPLRDAGVKPPSAMRDAGAPRVREPEPR